MSHPAKVYGLGAEFESAAALLEAAEKIRDRGFSHWDVHSPFPIHGMDKAMGLGKSWLSAGVFAAGFVGLLTGLGLASIPSFVLYPIIVHGKPYDWKTLPAFFPIMFEPFFFRPLPPCLGCSPSTNFPASTIPSSIGTGLNASLMTAF
jgi:hypothetical protein